MNLARATLRLRKFKEKRNRTKNNNLFTKSNKLYYTSLQSTSSTVSDPPGDKEVTNVGLKSSHELLHIMKTQLGYVSKRKQQKRSKNRNGQT
eukprot:13891759-Ditylum_brightwellii.AAC.1